ncbi:MAG: acyl-CoA dehydrogenase [Ilumatobacteraceae bacterium]|nr:acyl-CoA dehydrogenase [Ilumatobacteraceae bacterium]
MDFWRTQDQEALQDGIRSFCQGRFPIESLQPIEAAGGRLDRTAWRDLAGVGVFSLRHDGFSMTDSALVFEELGRALIPGPLTATYLAATHLHTVLAGADSGERIVGLAHVAEPVTMAEHLIDLDSLLILQGDSIAVVDPNSVPTQIVDRPLDPLTPVHVMLSTTGGEVVATGDIVRQWCREGAVLTAAMQVGTSFAAIDLAVEYAKGREQFGRPIGTFQAVKHMAADMLVKAEVARAATYAAAVNLDGNGDDDLDRAVSVAKMLAGDAALFCGKTGIQIHGGMGFTWEVNAQRYWKRAVVLDTHYGNSEIHADALAGSM